MCLFKKCAIWESLEVLLHKKSPIFNFYIVYDTITPNADVFLFCFVFFPTFYL